MDCEPGPKSCVWTSASRRASVAAMDDDTLSLVRQLCTRAGTLMEDVSVAALVWDPEKLSVSGRVEELKSAIEQMRALIAAAQALLAGSD